jgi:hypothetical protein
MDLGPLHVEQAIADTRRLVKEGFVVVTVVGARRESAWNFLFGTVDESDCFMRSMQEIVQLCAGARVADYVVEAIAANYRTVRYTFTSEADARKCRAWCQDG